MVGAGTTVPVWRPVVTLNSMGWLVLKWRLMDVALGMKQRMLRAFWLAAFERWRVVVKVSVWSMFVMTGRRRRRDIVIRVAGGTFGSVKGWRRWGR